MNAKQLIVLATLATAAAASFAGPIGDVSVEHTTFVSTRARADVQAEARQARHSGELMSAADEGVAAPVAAPAVPRAAVKSDVLQARANGELAPGGDVVTLALHPVRHVRVN
jgi:hypothetical protein